MKTAPPMWRGKEVKMVWRRWKEGKQFVTLSMTNHPHKPYMVMWGKRRCFYKTKWDAIKAFQNIKHYKEA